MIRDVVRLAIIFIRRHDLRLIALSEIILNVAKRRINLVELEWTESELLLINSRVHESTHVIEVFDRKIHLRLDWSRNFVVRL